jgi:hypothetical protein
MLSCLSAANARKSFKYVTISTPELFALSSDQCLGVSKCRILDTYCKVNELKVTKEAADEIFYERWKLMISDETMSISKNSPSEAPGYQNRQLKSL